MTITATGNRMTSEIARQQRLANDIARTQISISTGRRIQRPSDDPLAAARVADIARAQADGASWNSNLALATDLASQADGVLSALSDRMSYARAQMVAGANGAASPADRATFAADLRGVATEVAQLRATQSSLGQPLFATGSPTNFRLDSTVVLAPVDSAAAVFEPGGVPLTSELTDAADALESGDPARIATALQRLGASVEHVSDVRGLQGTRAAQVDRISDRSAARSIDNAVERSALEDTDISAAITKLNSQQLTLEAAQAAFARINRTSLFDLLR